MPYGDGLASGARASTESAASALASASVIAGRVTEESEETVERYIRSTGRRFFRTRIGARSSCAFTEGELPAFVAGGFGTFGAATSCRSAAGATDSRRSR